METLCREGRVLGVVTSGGHGYTVGKTIAYGYVPAGDLDGDGYEIEVLGETLKAQRHTRALYDPQRAKILG